MWTSWGISSNTKHLGRILQMVDWMYSDEAQELVQWGREGEHFVLNGDGRHQYASSLQASYNPEGTIDPMNTLGLNHNRIMRVEKDNGVVEVPDALNAIIQGYSASVREMRPIIKLPSPSQRNSPAAEEIKMVTDTLVSEGVVAFVTGTRPWANLTALWSRSASRAAQNWRRFMRRPTLPISRKCRAPSRQRFQKGGGL